MGRDTAGRLIVKTREPFCCVPTDGGTLQAEFASMVVRVESLRERMSEDERQALGRACRDIEGLFESLLSQSFS